MHAQAQNVTATFGGYLYEGSDEVVDYVLEAMDGEVWLAATYIFRLEGPGDELGYAGIAWARDDNGRLHFVVEAGPDGDFYSYTDCRDAAWESAVSRCIVDDVEEGYDGRVDLAYDPRIPALVYGSKGDLYSRIPTN